MKRPKPRHELLAQLRSRFIAGVYPRLTVVVFVGLSGAAALGISALLYRLGIEQMGYRYAVATLGAYAVFLLLIRIWIALLRGNDPSSWLDAIPDISSGDAAPAGDALAGFSGGSSGGAGVSGSWGSPGDGASSLLVPDIDVDDAWPVVVALIVGGIVLLGAAAALIYVVYYAPVLLAEIALDAALVTGIYRRLRKQDARYWLSSAIRHTWKPAVVITVCLFALGSVIQWAVPTARTIGDLLR